MISQSISKPGPEFLRTHISGRQGKVNIRLEPAEGLTKVQTLSGHMDGAHILFRKEGVDG